MHGVFRLHGALSNLGPLVFIAAVTLQQRHAPDAPSWFPQAALAASLLTSLSGTLFPRHPLAGRGLATLGILGALAACAGPLSALPSATLFALIAAGTGLYLIWTSDAPVRRRVPPLAASVATARSAAVLSLLTWFLVIPVRLATGLEIALALAASLAISCYFTVRWLAVDQRGRGRKLALFGLAALLSVAAMAAFRDSAPAVLTAASLVPMLTLTASRESGVDVSLAAGPWDLLLVHPERMLVLTFLGLSATGTLLLSLPQSSADGTPLPGIDAAFTAVSAVCVTGLSVIDIGTRLSPFGQFVLIVLIQTGGLGIMTFSTAALALLGKRLSLRHEAVVASLSGEHRSEVLRGIRRVLFVTFGIEAAGALLLWIGFLWHGHPPAEALWNAVFTAVSGFCNAGFGLQRDSLVPYQSNALVLHTVALLIILGGLSPATVLSLPGSLARRHVSLQTRLVLVTTAALLAAGFVLVLTFEWRHSLDGLSVADKIHNAWLTAVVPRTAGFNSIDMLELHPATVTFTIALMFIGGSPGGTAGGIKTTTLAVLVLAVASAFRGDRRVAVYGRMIPHAIVYRTAAVVTSGVFMFAFILLLVQLTQSMPPITAAFEVVSALGTVGLTIGGTQLLDGIGKGLIMFAMFVGRVGPLSIFLFLAATRHAVPWKLPEEQIGVS